MQNTLPPLTVNQLKQKLGVSQKDSIAKVFITPDVAKEILERNNTNNRNISQSRVDFLVRNMKLGHFSLSNDMITFNDKGVLTNGQHRLAALVKFGIGLQFYVSFEVDNFMGMDTGKTRTVTDNALIFDDCDERLRDKSSLVCHKVIKCALQFQNGNYASQPYTQRELLNYANKYADDLLTCLDAGLFSGFSVYTGNSHKKVSHVAVFAGFFMAYKCGVDIALLRYIADVLKNGTSSSDFDKPILGLRDLILTTKGGGRELDIIRFTATQDCIYKVSKRLKSKKVKTDTYYYTCDL